MIYTCTLNPSVDYVVYVENFELGGLNRTTSDVKSPGGKGINVSRVLKRLGSTSKALGFVGGFTGRYVQDYLQNEGIETGFIQAEGDTRINIKLKTGDETEINGQGSMISADNIQALYEQIEQMQPGDLLVLAGSIPASLPKNFYEELTKKAVEKSVEVVVDTSGKALLDLVPHKPFLIKPNHHELGELFNVDIQTVNEAIPYGQKLVEMGAKNVVISMAGDGALLINEAGVYQANAPKGTVKNSVGAGDSLVGGFLASYSQDQDLMKAFHQGVASGSATAFSVGLCTAEHVEKLKKEIEITQRG